MHNRVQAITGGAGRVQLSAAAAEAVANEVATTRSARERQARAVEAAQLEERDGRRQELTRTVASLVNWTINSAKQASDIIAGVIRSADSDRRVVALLEDAPALEEKVKSMTVKVKLRYESDEAEQRRIAQIEQEARATKEAAESSKAKKLEKKANKVERKLQSERDAVELQKKEESSVKLKLQSMAEGLAGVSLESQRKLLAEANLKMADQAKRQKAKEELEAHSKHEWRSKREAVERAEKGFADRNKLRKEETRVWNRSWWKREWKRVREVMWATRKKSVEAALRPWALAHVARTYNRRRLVATTLRNWRETIRARAESAVARSFVKRVVSQAVDRYIAQRAAPSERARMLREVPRVDGNPSGTESVDGGTIADDLEQVRKAIADLAEFDRTINDGPVGMLRSGRRRGKKATMVNKVRDLRWRATERALLRMVEDRKHGRERRRAADRDADINIIVRYEMGIDLDATSQTVGVTVAFKLMSQQVCADVMRRWARATREPEQKKAADGGHHVRMLRIKEPTGSSGQAEAKDQTDEGNVLEENISDDENFVHQNPNCCRVGCPCTETYNGLPGEYCCYSCMQGTACNANYHHTHVDEVRAERMRHMGEGAGLPTCRRAQCPCTSTWNGQENEYCCDGCRLGKACTTNRHFQPFVSARTREAERAQGPGPVERALKEELRWATQRNRHLWPLSWTFDMGPPADKDAMWTLEKHVGKMNLRHCPGGAQQADDAHNARLVAIVERCQEIRYSMIATDDPMGVQWTKELEAANLERLAWVHRCKLSICALQELGYHIKHDEEGNIYQMRDEHGLVVSPMDGSGRRSSGIEGKARMMKETSSTQEGTEGEAASGRVLVRQANGTKYCKVCKETGDHDEFAGCPLLADASCYKCRGKGHWSIDETPSTEEGKEEQDAAARVHVRQQQEIVELRATVTSLSRRHCAQALKARRLKGVCHELINAIADGNLIVPVDRYQREDGTDEVEELIIQDASHLGDESSCPDQEGKKCAECRAEDRIQGKCNTALEAEQTYLCAESRANRRKVAVDAEISRVTFDRRWKGRKPLKGRNGEERAIIEAGLRGERRDDIFEKLELLEDQDLFLTDPAAMQAMACRIIQEAEHGAQGDEVFANRLYMYFENCSTRAERTADLRYVRATIYQTLRKRSADGCPWWELGIDHPYIPLSVLREMMGIPSGEETILPHQMLDDAAIFEKGNPGYLLGERSRSAGPCASGSRKRDHLGRYAESGAGAVISNYAVDTAAGIDMPIPAKAMPRTLQRQLHAWASGTQLFNSDGYCQGSDIEVMGIDPSTPPPAWWPRLVASSGADGGAVEMTIGDGEGDTPECRRDPDDVDTDDWTDDGDRDHIVRMIKSEAKDESSDGLLEHLAWVNQTITAMGEGQCRAENTEVRFTGQAECEARVREAEKTGATPIHGKCGDGSGRNCVLLPVNDDARAMRAKQLGSRSDQIRGARYELVVVDSGCTGMLFPHRWCGRNMVELLDDGSKKETSIAFGTADPSGQPLQPTCQGSLTALMVDTQGRAWVIRFDVVYILPIGACKQGFLSPAALRKAWVRSKGVDEVGVSCGTPGKHSRMTLAWAGEDGTGSDTTEGNFSFDLDDFCSTYYCRLYPIDALQKFEGDEIIGDIGRAIEVLGRQHIRAGTSPGEWIQTWIRNGRKRAGKALAVAYETIAEKSRRWDVDEQAKDRLLNEYAGGGTETPNRLQGISRYRWRERRDHKDLAREKAIEEARRRRGQVRTARGYEDALGGTFGVVPTTVGLVIARLDADGPDAKVDPLVKGRRAGENNDGPMKGQYPGCVRSDCPCTSTSDDTVGQYCAYACAQWGACSENYHPISWKRREADRQSGRKVETVSPRR